MVITPKPTSWIVGQLRDVATAEMIVYTDADGPSSMAVKEKVRQCLDGVMLSCVFDMDGLWEVLADLDRPVDTALGTVDNENTGKDAPVLEVQDSQDEDVLPLSTETSASPEQTAPEKILPELIVITHFSSLLNSLFAHREFQAAHSALQLLASHLRHLTRHLPTHPLLVLLNTTSVPSSSSSFGKASSSASLDPTLRSIFNPPPLNLPGYNPLPLTRMNKPTFGRVFAQLLDLHVLCTRVSAGGDGGFGTVVEVLLDEMGVWEGRMGKRRDREQRWGAVAVKEGRITDAFEERRWAAGEVRLASGFDGPRV